MFKRFISTLISFAFFSSLIGPAHAQPLLGLPEPGTMVNLSPAFTPVLMKGLKIHPEDPLKFDFIIDEGNPASQARGASLKEETTRLVKYFLASLTIPEKDLWVNLSPYEKDRMIAPNLGQTEMGRDMLAQDYILKQLTASLIYPENGLGKTFWDRVYSKAQQAYGANASSQIPVNTFNKVWIVADKADVYEHGNVAYIVAAHLKVMLEEDYLALQKNTKVAPVKAAKQSPKGEPPTSVGATQALREIVIPELEREVNTGKNFAPLRQMFYSMILASWYKLALKDALLTQIYGNKSKVKGSIGVIPAGPLRGPFHGAGIQSIYQRYLEAYKKGVFNYIKEDLNPANSQPTPRKYFSGGLQIFPTDPAQVVRITQIWPGDAAVSHQAIIASVDFEPVHLPTDAAMIGNRTHQINPRQMLQYAKQWGAVRFQVRLDNGGLNWREGEVEAQPMNLALQEIVINTKIGKTDNYQGITYSMTPNSRARQIAGIFPLFEVTVGSRHLQFSNGKIYSKEFIELTLFKLVRGLQEQRGNVTPYLSVYLPNSFEGALSAIRFERNRRKENSKFEINQIPGRTIFKVPNDEEAIIWLDALLNQIMDKAQSSNSDSNRKAANDNVQQEFIKKGDRVLFYVNAARHRNEVSQNVYPGGFNLTRPREGFVYSLNEVKGQIVIWTKMPGTERYFPITYRTSVSSDSGYPQIRSIEIIPQEGEIKVKVNAVMLSNLETIPKEEMGELLGQLIAQMNKKLEPAWLAKQDYVVLRVDRKYKRIVNALQFIFDHRKKTAKFEISMKPRYYTITIRQSEDFRDILNVQTEFEGWENRFKNGDRPLLQKKPNQNPLVDKLYGKYIQSLMAAASKDHAQLTLDQKGGIDFNASNMQLNRRQDNEGTQMRFDPAMVERIKREGFDGLEFKIESIVPINLPEILGLDSRSTKRHPCGVSGNDTKKV